MTDPPPKLPPTVERRLAAIHRRRAERAADRAAFAERRHHGLKARHEAKLAYLADLADRQAAPDEQPDLVKEEHPAATPRDNDAA